MSRSTRTAPLFSASTKLGFDNLYEGPALLNKLLEVRWVHDDHEQQQANDEVIDDKKSTNGKNGGGAKIAKGNGKGGNAVRSKKAATVTTTATATMKSKGKVRAGGRNSTVRKSRTSPRLKGVVSAIQPTQRFQFDNSSDSSSSTESFYSTSDDSAVTVQAVEDDSTHDYVDCDDIDVDVNIVKVIEPMYALVMLCYITASMNHLTIEYSLCALPSINFTDP